MANSNSKTQKYSRPLLIFYFLVVYVLAAFSWWTYLHLKNFRQQYELKLNVAELEFDKYKLDSDQVRHKSETLTNAKKRYDADLNMIIGEAVVFFLLLLFGTYKIHAAMRNETEMNQQQRNFLLSITHELKSPIAGIRLAIETLLTRPLDRAPQLRLLSNSMKDVERLQNLVENILLAAKLETAQNSLQPHEKVDLSAIMDELKQKFMMSFGQVRHFRWHTTYSLFVLADRIALVSMITNLIENAIKYSPKESNITISLQAVEAQKARIIIADEGVGIPDHEKAKIFTKFYRIGNEDTRKTKGTGLGLYIVKQLVDLHGGTIQIADNQPRGTIFIIELPYTEYIPPMEDEYAPDIADMSWVNQN
jgi:signal transduction histidine kinase